MAEMRQFAVRVHDELADAIDAARGDVPRNRWIVRLCERAVGFGEPGGPEGGPADDAQLRRAAPVVRETAAMARQRKLNAEKGGRS